MNAPPGRRPLSAPALSAALGRAGCPWRSVDLVARTGSTNADLVARAAAGAAEGLVLVAEAQSAGRGRLGRPWVSPPGAGLTFSVLLRPPPPVARWGWLPLLAGTAIAAAVRELAGVPAALKWPNDLLVGAPERKAAGVLAEVAGSAVVLGVGLNVSTTAAELPIPAATSLLLAGWADADRAELLVGLLGRLAADYAAWSAGADPRPAYLAASATVGRRIRAGLPDGSTVTGTAVDVDEQGRLVVRDDATGRRRRLTAGDVLHVRQ